ncbi:BPL-N domain-containing protein [Verrucomicrobiales bacterium]|nr:BPL-N domain-containing protein [Verrucomicrobiales bacterium]MDB4358991.1 BPL-N domain-containing protein [Verrucomicrobiales bacterium]
MKSPSSQFGLITIFCFGLAGAMVFAEADTPPGKSTYGQRRYTESIEGNAPILILVPDGGTMNPLNSSDEGTPRTSEVKLFARNLIAEINLLTGHYPHAIFNHLAPSYLDVSSEVTNYPEGIRAIAFKEYTGATQAAEKRVKSANGIVFDVCDPTKNSSTLTALHREAMKATKDKDFAISSLARGIIGELRQNASVNLYLRDDEKINVGIYRVGKSMSNAAIYAMRIDPEIRSIGIVSSQVQDGILDELDAIVLPGGSGAGQIRDLGPEGTKKVESFVESGGGYVGICAGAYSGAERTGGKSKSTLNLLGGIHPDHENKGWARGAAMVELENTEYAKRLLPEYEGADKIFYAYNQGPLLGIKEVPAVENYVVLQHFASDVHHKNPEAKGIMPGKVNLMIGNRKDGKVVLCSSHPEATPGMRWMAPRMIYWALGKDSVPYSSHYVRPNLYSSEAMYDTSRNKKTDSGLKLMLNSSEAPDKRVAMFKEIIKTNPRRFKSHADLLALLQDSKKAIRSAAVAAAVQLDFFEAASFLKEAYVHEPNEAVREQIKHAISIIDVL